MIVFNKHMAQLTQLKQMINVAMSDGRIDKQELAVISMFLDREEMSSEAFEKCVNHPNKIDFTLPKSKEERQIHIEDMITVMLSDGQVDEAEYNTCLLTAEAFGFSEKELNAIIDKVRQNIEDNHLNE